MRKTQSKRSTIKMKVSIKKPQSKKASPKKSRPSPKRSVAKKAKLKIVHKKTSLPKLKKATRYLYDEDDPFLEEKKKK